MDVKDYIDKLEVTNKIKIERLYSLKELSSYKYISNDKMELIRSVFPYLESESFTDAEHLYSDYTYPIENEGFVQTLSSDGVRALVPIRFAFQDDDTRPQIIISAASFNKQYNKIRKIGSQRYTHISLVRDLNSDEKEFFKIYYTEDGNVFLNSEASFIIRNRNIDVLGDELARICIYRKKNVEQKNHHNSKSMQIGYRNLNNK